MTSSSVRKVSCSVVKTSAAELPAPRTNTAPRARDWRLPWARARHIANGRENTLTHRNRNWTTGQLERSSCRGLDGGQGQSLITGCRRSASEQVDRSKPQPEADHFSIAVDIRWSVASDRSWKQRISTTPTDRLSSTGAASKHASTGASPKRQGRAARTAHLLADHDQSRWKSTRHRHRRPLG